MKKDWKILISGYLDNELTPDEMARFQQELTRNPALARELEEMKSMQEVTGSMKLKDFPDQVWERYWDDTYNRLERNIGWFFFSIGAMILMAGGLYKFVLSLLNDSGEPLWVRLAIGIGCSGLGILFISVLRERLFMRQRDPYREVKR